MKVLLTASERTGLRLDLEKIEKRMHVGSLTMNREYVDLVRKLLECSEPEPAAEQVWGSKWPQRSVVREVRETVYWKFPMAGAEWVCELNWSKDFGYRMRIEYGVRTDGPFGISDPQADDLRLAQDAEHFWEALRACILEWNQALRARIDGWEAACQG